MARRASIAINASPPAVAVLAVGPSAARAICSGTLPGSPRLRTGTIAARATMAVAEGALIFVRTLIGIIAFITISTVVIAISALAGEAPEHLCERLGKKSILLWS